MKSATPMCPFNRLAFLFGLTTTFGCAPTAPERPQSPCASLATGDLVITEFMADPVGSDTGKQYIEIYNATDRSIDLSGLSLFQSMADGSRENATVLRSALLPAGTYYVLGDAGSDAQARPIYLNYGYGNEIGALRHENGKLGLRCGTTLVAEVGYSKVSAGYARELDGASLPGTVDAHSETAWCNATTPLNALLPAGDNFGTPGAPNPPCGRDRTPPMDGGVTAQHSEGTINKSTAQTDTEAVHEQCFDAALGSQRAIRRPEPGQLLLTEVMPAPSVNNNGPGEWFEALATHAVDLNGIILENEGSGATVLAHDTCLSVMPGDWLLFARSNDATQNGGLPRATALFDFTIADAASTSHSERAVTLRTNQHPVDRVAWSKSTKGRAWQRSAGSSTSGVTLEWCPALASSSYGAGDHGTPGAANVACPQVSDAGAATNSNLNGGTSGTLDRTSDAGGGRAANSAGGTSSVLPSGGAPNAAGAGGLPTESSRSAGTGGVRLAATSATGGVAQFAQGGAGGGLTNTSASTTGTGGGCTDLDASARALVAPRPGDLIITEVMSAPSANNNGAAEWFEVLVTTDLDLNGVEFGNEGTGRLLITGEACIRVNAGERLVFARSSDFEQNGGLPFLSDTFGFTLADTASSSHPERMLLLRYDGVVLDRVTWTKSTKGASWQRSEEPSSALDGGLISPDASTAVIELWCVSPPKVTFGSGDRGTPGFENEICE